MKTLIVRIEELIIVKSFFDCQKYDFEFKSPSLTVGHVKYDIIDINHLY